MAFDLNNPMYLTAYAQLSLQAGESTEADLYLFQLKRLAPNELTTVDIEVQIAYDRGQYEKIAKILKNIGDVGLKSEQKAVDAEITSRLWAAKRLEEFARLLSIPKESETAAQEENRNQARALMIASSEYCYEKFVAERPEEMLIYAQFLSQTPRVDRALDLLQEYGPTSSPMLVANMAITMMKNPRASSQQLQRLQQLFEAYMQNHEKILILELTATELRSWSGDYPGAIAAYRKLLEKNGRSMAILNNLSVLLAQVGGDTEEALRLIEQAIEFATAIPELLDSRGLIHLAAKRPEKALADFQLSLNRLESPVTRFHLAVALAELKQFGEATKSLSIADAGSFTEQDLHPLERNMLKSLRVQLKEYSSTAKNP
jgi:tetratricopeptide (TPR) repeat protein